MEITDKTVLITGASSGLGRGIALELGRRGNRIIATARRRELLESLREEIEGAGGHCLPLPSDSTDTEAVESTVARGIAEFGQLHVALLNAGGGVPTSILNTTSSEILRQMRMNFDTAANYLCPLVAHMKDKGGTIAYTSSPAGIFAVPKTGPYGAAKGACDHLFDSARMELSNTPIKVVALYPGFVYTDGLNPDDVPFKGLIISRDRAVSEMIRAMERGRARHMFPKRIKALITLGRWIPEPLRRRLLSTL